MILTKPTHFFHTHSHEILAALAHREIYQQRRWKIIFYEINFPNQRSKSHSLDFCLPLPSDAHMPKGKGRKRQDDSFHFLSPQSTSLCDSRISNASLCRCSPLALQYKVKLNAELNYLLDIFFLKAQLPYIHTQTRVYACVCVCSLVCGTVERRQQLLVSDNKEF